MSRIYRQAACALERVLCHGRSPKSAVYDLFPSKQFQKELPTVMALLTETVRQYNELRSCLIQNGLILARQAPERGSDGRGFFVQKAGVASEGQRSNRQSAFMLLLMASDLLRGHKIRGGGNLKRKIDSVPNLKEKLRESVAVDGSEEKKEFPRYLRVDLSRVSRSDAIEAVTEAFPELGCTVDPLIDTVLVLESRRFDARLRQWAWMKDGRVVMMDRATCLSAKAAVIEPDDIILDVCAAPGSKTLSYLSCLRGAGVVIAIEKDEDRFGTLLRRVARESVFTRVRKLKASDYNLGSPVSLENDDALDKLGLSENDKTLAKKGKQENGNIRKEKEDKGGGYIFTTPQHPNLRCFCLLADFMSEVCDCASDLQRETDRKTKNGEEETEVRKLSGSRKLPGSGYCGRKWCLERLFDKFSCAKRRGLKVSLDPTCSGSGLSEHKFGTTYFTKQLADRVDRLSAFQALMLRKALNLPRVELCLYSTCSLFFEENEAVVTAALSDNFLVDKAVDNWSNAPVVSINAPLSHPPPWLDLCLRAAPEEHQCRGFFLAKLVKKSLPSKVLQSQPSTTTMSTAASSPTSRLSACKASKSPVVRKFKKRVERKRKGSS